MILWLAAFSLLCAGGPAFLFLRNLTVLRPPPPGISGENAAVLIPARNEARNIRAAVEAALASGAGEVAVLDDGSSDQTAEIVRQAAALDSRVLLLSGAKLPEGWVGKNFACHQLAAATSKAALIFIDADVRLAPEAASRLVAALRESPARLLSGIPREITTTFSAQLLIPLIHFLLLGFLPFDRMRRSLHPAYGTACGQLLVVDAEAYRATGGHAAVRAAIHEGLALPKSFRAHGLQTDLFEATELATCRMYETNAEVWRGLLKNTHEGLGAPRVIVPMTILLLAGQVLPFVLFFTTQSAVVRGIAAVAAVCALLPRFVSLGRFHQPLLSALLHPLGILALLGIQWFGLWRYLRGQPARWKGRAYEVSQSSA